MAPLRNAEAFAGSVDFGVLTVREDELEPVARRCRAVAVRELIVAGRQDYFLFDIALGKPNAATRCDKAGLSPNCLWTILYPVAQNDGGYFVPKPLSRNPRSRILLCGLAPGGPR
jgi:hypothetical protein